MVPSLRGFTYEVSLFFSAPGAGLAEQARSLFASLGIPEDQIVESSEKDEIRLSFYTTARHTARGLKEALRGQKPGGIHLSLSRLSNARWQTLWKHYSRPAYLTRRVRAVPWWMFDKAKARPRDILIDGNMAFGTGSHPTTRAMARFIEGHEGEFSSFLDIGTGTGVLGIMAGRCGAKDVWGVDIEPASVAAAARNAELNGFHFDYLDAMDFRVFPFRRRFDYVAANLLVPVLLSFKYLIMARVRPGKFLAVSGIWKDDEARFLREFLPGRLKRISLVRDKGWVSILYRRVKHESYRGRP